MTEHCLHANFQEPSLFPFRICIQFHGTHPSLIQCHCHGSKAHHRLSIQFHFYQTSHYIPLSQPVPLSLSLVWLIHGAEIAPFNVDKKRISIVVYWRLQFPINHPVTIRTQRSAFESHSWEWKSWNYMQDIQRRRPRCNITRKWWKNKNVCVVPHRAYVLRPLSKRQKADMCVPPIAPKV